jgi:hypothetical protein
MDRHERIHSKDRFSKDLDRHIEALVMRVFYVMLEALQQKLIDGTNSKIIERRICRLFH